MSNLCLWPLIIIGIVVFVRGLVTPDTSDNDEPLCNGDCKNCPFPPCDTYDKNKHTKGKKS